MQTYFKFWQNRTNSIWDSVIYRNKTPSYSQISSKTGLIPAFNLFQGLSVLGQLSAKKCTNEPYEWNFSKILQYNFIVKYLVSKKDWKLPRKPHKVKKFPRVVILGLILTPVRVVLFRHNTVQPFYKWYPCLNSIADNAFHLRKYSFWPSLTRVTWILAN